MNAIRINSYEQIINLRSYYNQRYENAILYRGTPNQLLPSLVEKCSFKTYQDLTCKELALHVEFAKSSNLNYLYKNSIAQDWEARIAGREHGLANSLMDWSNSLEIAVEFAIHDFENKMIDFTSIWFLVRLNIEQIHVNETTSIHFNEIDKPTIVNYNLGADYSEETYSKRKSVQGGYFLKQPNSDILTPVNQNYFFRDKLLQIIIPGNEVSEVRSSLSHVIDMTQTALPFGTKDSHDLDNICQKLNSRYA